MSTVDFGDYTVTTTVTPNGRTAQTVWKPGTDGANREQLQAKAQQALTANATFLALASPTAAQVAAQVKLLTREMNAVLRLLVVQSLTDISDT